MKKVTMILHHSHCASGLVAAQAVKTSPSRPQIQLAILLDTSGSMDGLIGQAKSRLWKIVNELATAKKDGQAPQLQVALYEYGQDSLSAASGYLRLHRPAEPPTWTASPRSCSSSRPTAARNTAAR